MEINIMDVAKRIHNRIIFILKDGDYFKNVTSEVASIIKMTTTPSVLVRFARLDDITPSSLNANLFNTTATFHFSVYNSKKKDTDTNTSKSRFETLKKLVSLANPRRYSNTGDPDTAVVVYASSLTNIEYGEVTIGSVIYDTIEVELQISIRGTVDV